MNSTAKIIAMSGLMTNRKYTLATEAICFLSQPYALEALLENVLDLMRS